MSWTWWIIAGPYRGSLCSILEQSIRDWWWSASRWFCPDITMLPTFHIHHPRLESVVLWSIWSRTYCIYSHVHRPVSPFFSNKPAKCLLPVEYLLFANFIHTAVCFVTLHVLNSARRLSLSNVTTLLLNLTFRWPCIVINSYNKKSTRCNNFSNLFLE